MMGSVADRQTTSALKQNQKKKKVEEDVEDHGCEVYNVDSLVDFVPLKICLFARFVFIIQHLHMTTT